MVESQSVTRFDGADVVPLMTADEARECVSAINSHMNSARAELLRLYEGRGWESLGYASWRECAETEFGQTQTHLYRQLAAAEIEQRISPRGEIGTIPEKHLRPLTRLTPIEQPAAWELAHQYAEAEGAPRLTARHVEEAVEEMAPRLTIVPRASVDADSIDDDDDTLDPPMEPAQVADLPRPQPRANAGLFTSATPEWYTPRHIIDRVVQVFGEIDLDPCSNSREAPNVPALNHYTARENGLSREWFGRVYMNPPYGDEIPQWVDRLVQAYEGEEIDAAIALLPARIDTNWFQPLWDYALCFVKGRLRFSGAENSAPFPSVVVYLGPDVELFKETFAAIGRCGILL